MTAVRSLALRRAPPCPTAAPIATKNRFSDLLVDEIDCGEDEPAADVAAATATSCVDSKNMLRRAAKRTSAVSSLKKRTSYYRWKTNCTAVQRQC